MGAGHQRAGHQTRLALDGPRYSLRVDMRTLIRMTVRVKMRRTRIEHMSAGLPPIADIARVVGTAEKCHNRP
jgi:hypothetical protein